MNALASTQAGAARMCALPGERFWLHPERAVWWPQAGALLVADLHWGKDAAFRAAGCALPQGMLEDDLRRLSALQAQLQAREVIILGDLIHARSSLHASVVDAVARWRETFGAALTLVEGNHDRWAPRLPEAWGIARHPAPLVRAGVILRHVPEVADAGFTWAGHLHPSCRIRGRGRESLRLPCFRVGPQLGILPAFSHFTGRLNLGPFSELPAYAILGDQVLPMQPGTA